MPRYHLHVYNRIGHVLDEEGMELADLAAAREKALEGIRAIVAEEAKAGRIDLAGHVDITDGSDELVDTIVFREAFKLNLDEDEACP